MIYIFFLNRKKFTFLSPEYADEREVRAFVDMFPKKLCNERKKMQGEFYLVMLSRRKVIKAKSFQGKMLSR